MTDALKAWLERAVATAAASPNRVRKVGAVLARMEGTIAIGCLIRRFDGLARDGAAERGGRARFRGFNRYPIAWSQRKTPGR